ncbi:chemotaxis protein CheR [Pseudoxanthomonas sp. SL93]|uniref:CheR family methyltransferase n=1 Tax=Pseudoxanthomonas sp. SL93 TaxID=2995142 RepID=UPI002271BE4C|nr:CheR family methyltransferase [Pseudoxanthomonas sp. SL93]WAC63821.1 chemotaxis protein CheR [Pseudoxanthomonas sp. SL93]
MSVSTRHPAPAATTRRTPAPPRDDDARPAAGNRDFDFDDRDFRRVCELIRERAGIALADGKRDMVYGRLSRRLRALGLRSFKDYLDQLERDGGDEWQAFTNALTTNLTSFFREPHHFERLREELGRRVHDGPLKLWSCASSTGEEPYSIAITACEAYGTMAPPIRILATDVDTQVLATGERGVYPIERIASLDDALKRRYFQRGSGPNEGFCRIHPALRQLIDFRPLNLLAPRYDVAGPFTAVFCRNVMIYFDKPTQRGILTRLVPHLADDGMLYTGHSENYLHAADIIQPCGRTLYRRAGTGA